MRSGGGRYPGLLCCDTPYHDLRHSLGTADLVSQIAGRYYLERCRHYLYCEFVIAGADRKTGPGGETIMLYESPEDLLRKTPDFYKYLAKKRLEGDFDLVYRYVARHFDGDNPYERGMPNNLGYLDELITRNDFSALSRRPVPLMPLPVVSVRTSLPGVCARCCG